jgi:putative protease
MEEIEVGEVSHYFSKIGVAAIKITADSIKVGDTIHVKGHTSDFTQQIDSLQVEHTQVQVAKPGDIIGLKIKDHAREGDKVFKVIA